MPRLWIPVLAITLLACAGCDGASDAPSAAVPSSPSSSSAVTPSPSVPSELVRFSAAEREAYEAARAAYRRFTARNDRLLARGQTTEPASEFYHRYSVKWVDAWANLAQLANNDVTITGRSREVWVRPVDVSVGANGEASVQLRRCLDESQLVVRQAGKVVAQPQLRKPHVYSVRVVRRAAEDHWRSGTASQGRKC